MKAKEKAKQLVEKYIDLQDENLKECDYIFSKQCALIAVDEIFQTDPMIDCGESDSGTEYKSNDSYWNEVKQEINKL